jgi:hypothetical protein
MARGPSLRYPDSYSISEGAGTREASQEMAGSELVRRLLPPLGRKRRGAKLSIA